MYVYMSKEKIRAIDYLAYHVVTAMVKQHYNGNAIVLFVQVKLKDMECVCLDLIRKGEWNTMPLWLVGTGRVLYA